MDGRLAIGRAKRRCALMLGDRLQPVGKMPAQEPRAAAIPGRGVFLPLVVAANSSRLNATAREKKTLKGSTRIFRGTS
jgi:hypothetical protein